MIDPRTDRSTVGMGFGSRDFESAGAKVIQSILASSALRHRTSELCNIEVTRFINNMIRRSETGQLVKRIRMDLLKSIKIVTTTAVGLKGAQGRMSMRAKRLRGSSDALWEGSEPTPKLGMDKTVAW